MPCWVKRGLIGFFSRVSVEKCSCWLAMSSNCILQDFDSKNGEICELKKMYL